MNIVDAVIILVLLMGAALGFKRGLTGSLLNLFGFILAVVVAYLLKNPVSALLYKYLPFFSFGGIIKGVTVLNIALYELIAFLLVFSVFLGILNVLMYASKVFERILTFTIVLGIPSKILGALVGIVQNYIVVFIALYLVSLPIFNIDIVNESKYKDRILNNTPVLSNMMKNTLDVIKEFGELEKKFREIDDPNQFNLETLDLFLKHKVVSVDSVKGLINSGKLKINGAENIIKKYEGEK